MKHTHPIIEKILEDNKVSLGKHLNKYKNHVYRVFLLCQSLDDNEKNIEKYAIAAVFHDIGIWSAMTFDYLEPSVQMATQYLIATGKEEWREEISIMIEMHHKRSRYKGDCQQTVEIFRRADWIDVTKGRMSFNLSKEVIRSTSDQYPNLGFHRFLIVQTLKNILKSPHNPLPMFKK